MLLNLSGWMIQRAVRTPSPGQKKYPLERSRHLEFFVLLPSDVWYDAWYFVEYYFVDWRSNSPVYNNWRNCMKTRNLAFLSLVGLSLLPKFVQAASAPVVTTKDYNTNQYDPIVLPISSAALQAGLIRNSKNALEEYVLLLRAGYQHQEKAACDTMSQLRGEQPNNPIVLAGYFMALRMAQGGMNSIRYNGGHQAMPFNDRDDEEAKALLRKAYQLNSNLWLTYAIDGEDRCHDPKSRKQGIALLQKAERLAPDNPYTHWLLGDAYLYPPPDQNKYTIAAYEFKKALASGAKISSAAFTLFEVYSVWLPDRTEATKWKGKFYSLVPPNVKINPAAKQILDRYPG